MNQVTVTLPDGSTRSFPHGTSVLNVAADISPRLAKAALAIVINDQIVDLSHIIEHDVELRVVTTESPEALDLYRHSTAHLMAAAVTSLFPETQCGIGPAIENGFFYDFVVKRPFVPEDLEAIESKMRELSERDLKFERKLMNKEEAKGYFTKRGEPLKVQLIEEKGGPTVSCYTIEDVFIDFCVGPHVPSTGKLKAVKLQSTSNAYWKADARNQPMQRVYGTAFFSEKALKNHLHQLEETKKRDHRKIGRELGLFMFHSLAPGAPFWLSKGTCLWNILADYMRSVLASEGYVELRTPLVFNKQLWEKSGHWEHYRQNMFLVESEGEPFGIKAMNCPGHMLVFASELRSYRDLPIRFHDQSVLHRNEASGVLSGLTRVRQFSQDDAHCFVSEDQIAEEVDRLLRLVQRVNGDLDLGYRVQFSTRPEEFLGEISTWDHAETSLRQALEAAGQPYTINEGDGAFYGPKIDFDVTDAIGRKWQCATIQLDYQLPRRFNLKYIGADNSEHCPVVIHRAIFGSFERFIALLIENYAGAFPLWLAPVQTKILPIADRHTEYARNVQNKLEQVGLRSELDDRQEKIGFKIREAQLQKVPLMLVVGDREVADTTVAVRSRSDGDQGTQSLEECIASALEQVQRKS